LLDKNVLGKAATPRRLQLAMRALRQTTRSDRRNEGVTSFNRI
jgi:hypothetical protein